MSESISQIAYDNFLTGDIMLPNDMPNAHNYISLCTY